MLKSRKHGNYGGMMSSYDSMKTKLDAIGIYSINADSNLSKELKAYAEGLDSVFGTIDTMTKEFFIETADDYGIVRRERFLEKERSEYSIEKRREMLILQEQDIGGKCNSEAFSNILKSYGLSDFSFIETPSLNRLTIQINDTLSVEIKEMVTERINLDFPAHLALIISFSQ